LAGRRAKVLHHLGRLTFVLEGDATELDHDTRGVIHRRIRYCESELARALRRSAAACGEPSGTADNQQETKRGFVHRHHRLETQLAVSLKIRRRDPQLS